MTTRKQTKKQHRLQRQTERQSSERSQLRSRLIKAGLATAAAVVIIALAVIVRPWSSSSGEAEANLPALALSIGDNFFQPDTLTIQAGQKYRLEITNQGLATHDAWFAGSDGQTSTGDDIRTDPIPGGGSANEKIKYDNPGTYYFVCAFHAGQGGTLVVQ